MVIKRIHACISLPFVANFLLYVLDTYISIRARVRTIWDFCFFASLKAVFFIDFLLLLSVISGQHGVRFDVCDTTTKGSSNDVSSGIHLQYEIYKITKGQRIVYSS